MVLGDLNYKQLLPASKNIDTDASSRAPFARHRLAMPIDRVAGWVADLILFMPFAMLLVSPLRRKATEAQLLGSDSTWFSYLLAIFAAMSVLYVIYQTLFVYYGGSTPGQRVMGLRVVPVWGGGVERRSESQTGRWEKKITPIDAFARALTHLISLVLFGFPLLGALSNRLRRTVADRLSDTVVVTERASRAAGPPTSQEISLTSGLTMALAASVATLLGIQLLHIFRSENSESASAIASLEDHGSLCRMVGAAHRDWLPSKGEKVPVRINVAISLFAAGAIDEECLSVEADHALWKKASNDERAEAYLAYSLAHGHLADSKPDLLDENQTEQTAANEAKPKTGADDRYRDKPCEIAADSDACRAIGILTMSGLEQGTLTNKQNLLTNEIKRSSAAYLRIWAVQAQLQLGNVGEALSLIDSLSHDESLAPFVLTQRAKALWRSGSLSESRSMARSAIEAGKPEVRIETARWWCVQETFVNGCAEPSRRACSMLLSVVDKNRGALNHDDIAVAYLRGLSCENDLDQKRLVDLTEDLTHDDERMYLTALEKIAAKKTAEAVTILKEVVAVPSESGSFALEARLKLLEISNSPETVRWVKNSWLEAEGREEAWIGVGARLMDKLNSFGDWVSAVEVGRLLAEANALDSRTRRVFAYASANAAKSGRANGAGLRLPASVLDETSPTANLQPADEHQARRSRASGVR